MQFDQQRIVLAGSAGTGKENFARALLDYASEDLIIAETADVLTADTGKKADFIVLFLCFSDANSFDQLQRSLVNVPADILLTRCCVVIEQYKNEETSAFPRGSLDILLDRYNTIMPVYVDSPTSAVPAVASKIMDVSNNTLLMLDVPGNAWWDEIKKT
ncbi:MAG: hypothetical protein EZS28_004566 [Streblomastix strix]|uniref:Uncharacterized protein n=1 Tax=Streblomastix strix TaxID=222440 RepID=A0A5J4WZX5_9EUKA|nr:MAG: hypothetical protein EZS28_004566 [Streblomastix strix]